jgi:hypothetical protein
MILNSLFRLDFSQTTSCAITNFFGPSTLTQPKTSSSSSSKNSLTLSKRFHLQHHQFNTETHKYLICKIVLPFNEVSNLNWNKNEIKKEEE